MTPIQILSLQQEIEDRAPLRPMGNAIANVSLLLAEDRIGESVVALSLAIHPDGTIRDCADAALILIQALDVAEAVAEFDVIVDEAHEYLPPR